MLSHSSNELAESPNRLSSATETSLMRGRSRFQHENYPTLIPASIFGGAVEIASLVPDDTAVGARAVRASLEAV
jgi:hypothetical protein